MTALRQIFNKDARMTTPLETCILHQWTKDGDELAEQAAAELAALRGENERLRSALASAEAERDALAEAAEPFSQRPKEGEYVMIDGRMFVAVDLEQVDNLDAILGCVSVADEQPPAALAGE